MVNIREARVDEYQRVGDLSYDAYLPLRGAGDLDKRVRTYLAVNCSQCHQPGGPTPVNLDLRYTTSLANTNACDVEPTSDDLGIEMARIIAPGDAARSVLVARMNVRGSINAMPPLGSGRVDIDGTSLVSRWIKSLESCGEAAP